MAKINIEIDKLTNSIVNKASGDVFNTEIMEVTVKDLKKTTKKNGWKFNWSKEKQEIDTLVFKIVIENNENVIQGMVCLIDKGDHIYLK